MDAIWDRDGHHVGWIDPANGAMWDPDAQRNIGFVTNSGVYTATGEARGAFTDGFLRNAQGDPVAFVKEATGGPQLPFVGGAPYAPTPPYVQVPSYFPPPGWTPSGSMSWSTSSLDQLVA